MAGARRASSNGLRPRRCSSCRRSPSTSARRSPCCCSTRSSPGPSPGCASSAPPLALLAVGGRWWTTGLGTEFLSAALFGIATALMNLFFYLAIARTDLGKSVAIEFIGPITVAAVMTRSRRNAGALALAATGVVMLGGVEIGGNTTGLAVDPCGLGDVGRLHRARVPSGAPAHRVQRSRGRARRRCVGADADRRTRQRARLPRAGAAGGVPRRRRVLERHRLRHRPARAATDPGAPVLGPAGDAARHGRRGRLDRPRPATVVARPRRHRAWCWPASPSRSGRNWPPSSPPPTPPDILRLRTRVRQHAIRVLAYSDDGRYSGLGSGEATGEAEAGQG